MRAEVACDGEGRGREEKRGEEEGDIDGGIDEGGNNGLDMKIMVLGL